MLTENHTPKVYLNNEDFIAEKLFAQNSNANYIAMYNSLHNSIVLDSRLMFTPIDDHMVHRGDAVFEAIKFVSGHIYGLKEHIARLFRSMKSIEMNSKFNESQICELIEYTIKQALKNSKDDTLKKNKTGMVRLYHSRGPGSFSPNPYECQESVLYIVITKFKPMSENLYQQGVRATVAPYLAKDSFYAQIKSCNYLQNVLVKKYSVDKNYDFAISLDVDGFITEGPTENCAIISSNDEFIIPSFENTLKGITISRAIELAKEDKESLGLKSILIQKVSKKDIFSAKEMAFIGTTLDILPVQELDLKRFYVGPEAVFTKLNRLLTEDILNPKSSLVTTIHT